MLFEIEASVNKYLRLFQIAKEIEPKGVSKILKDLKKSMTTERQKAKEEERIAAEEQARLDREEKKNKHKVIKGVKPIMAVSKKKFV